MCHFSNFLCRYETNRQPCGPKGGTPRDVGEGGRGAPDLSQVTEEDPGEVDLQEREAGEPEATSRSLGPSAKREKAGERMDARRRSSTAIPG